jgi:hypothetical protein
MSPTHGPPSHDDFADNVRMGGVGSGRRRKVIGVLGGDLVSTVVEEPASPPEPTTPSLDYDVRVKGPTPTSPGKFVLVLYDRPTPFGIRSTIYDVDYLVYEKPVFSGYLGDALVVQFPKDLTYVLVAKSAVEIVESKDDETPAQVGFVGPAPPEESVDAVSKGYL